MENNKIHTCENCNLCKTTQFQVPNDPKCQTHYTSYCKYSGNFLAINYRASEKLPLPKNCPIAAFNLTV